MALEFGKGSGDVARLATEAEDNKPANMAVKLIASPHRSSMQGLGRENKGTQGSHHARIGSHVKSKSWPGVEH